MFNYRNKKLLNNHKKSNKLIILAISEEFFKSNFWTFSKEYLKNFDICCINYSIYYCLKKSINVNYFFALDFTYIMKVHYLCKNNQNILFIDNEEILSTKIYQHQINKSKKIIFFDFNEIFKLYIKTCATRTAPNINDSGVCALYFFIKSSIYKEIHLIGLNMIPDSGAFNLINNKYIHGSHKDRINKFSSYVKFIKFIITKYNYESVYKTYDKSKLFFLKKSDIFCTLKKEQINKDIEFKKKSFKKL